MTFYDSNNATSEFDDSNNASVGEEEEEQLISAYFVFFSALLAVVLIFSRLLHDYPRVASIIPEAGMILITGVIFGAIIDLFFVGTTMTMSTSSSSHDDNYQQGNNNNNNNQNNENGNDMNDDFSTDNDDGTGTGETVAVSLLNFSPAVFFLVLLPPIIFNSGYNLRKELFFRHLTPICLLAVVGTVISTLLTAIFLQIICQHVLKPSDNNDDDDESFTPTFTELLTFGALLSATDPVSTLAVFQVKRVDPQLFYLVFGESVLNDAVSLVLFDAFKKFVKKDNGAGKVAVGISEFLISFMYDSVGSPLLGLCFGVAAAWLFKKIDFRPTKILELSLFILIMYVPFLLAELLDLSGIVTILFSGLAAKAYVVPNLSTTTVQHADVLIHLASHLAETAIFLELGLSVFGLTGSIHGPFIFWTIVVCLVARAANVYPITYLYNKSLPPVSNSNTNSNRALTRNRRRARRQGAITTSVDRGLLSPGSKVPTDSNSVNATNNHSTELELTNLPTSADRAKEGANSPADKKGSTTTAAVGSSSPPLADDENDNDEDDGLMLDGDIDDELRIPPKTAHMVWFSGLRGAVAYACVRSFPNTFNHADEFTMTTMIVVLVSVFGLGSTTECMLNTLKIRMNVDETSYHNQREQQMRQHQQQQSSSASAATFMWIRSWENFLYRRVVRGADGNPDFDHMVIGDSNDADDSGHDDSMEEDEEYGGNDHDKDHASDSHQDGASKSAATTRSTNPARDTGRVKPANTPPDRGNHDDGSQVPASASSPSRLKRTPPASPVRLSPPPRNTSQDNLHSSTAAAQLIQPSLDHHFSNEPDGN